MYLHQHNRHRHPSTRGLTLVELLAASTVMALVAGGIAALAVAVQTSSDFHFGRGTTLQHGRVAMERIQRSVTDATANPLFPGFVVFTDQIYGEALPDTLVVWLPDAEAADPDGMPLMSELVTFCADPDAPQRLLEIRMPNDNRVAPPLDDATWQIELETIKTSASAERVELTDLLRVVPLPEQTDLPPRAAIRFDATLRPSAAEWIEYQSGTRAWNDVSWVQGIYGPNRGLRQGWCRIELQLRPADVTDHSRQAATPFFGSGTVYYELER